MELRTTTRGSQSVAEDGVAPSVPTAYFLAGPTAVGKTELALRLAERVGGEIISVDSMQVYRGLDVGTAKATAAERARIPHHLIDVVDLTGAFDAAQFVRRAHDAATAISGRGHVPIFCGGTGLYFRAYQEGLGEAPPADAALRGQLEHTPLDELWRELEAADPITFGRIDRQNPRRVIRAVEVIRRTGRPFSEQRADWSQSKTESTLADGVCLCFQREAAELRSRIDRRVDAMFRAGLVAETENLLKQGLAQNQTAMQAIGYRQVVEHLRGERSLEETIEWVKIRTRQFAKRQLTWFRRQPHFGWVTLSAEDSATDLVEQLLAGTLPVTRESRPTRSHLQSPAVPP